MNRTIGWVLLFLNAASILWHTASPYGTMWVDALNCLGFVTVAITLAVTADR